MAICSCNGDAECSGGFFDGYRVRLFNQVTWKPNKHILLGAGLGYNDIELSGGDFITRLGTFRANIAITNKWSLLNFIQYDNVSDLAGLNSRIRWIIEPGRDFFAVVNQGLIIDHGIESASTEISLKIGWNFRF